MLRAASSAGAAALLAACVPVSELALPDLDGTGGTRSLLLLAVPEQGRSILYAETIEAARAGWSVPFAARDGTQLWLIHSAYTLEDLQLPRGEIAYLEGTPLTRALPAPLRVLGRKLGEAQWTVAEQAQAAADLRVAPLDAVTCASRGGCVVPGVSGACTTPCPRRDAPRPPMAPAVPMPPALPMLGCTPGWIVRPREAERIPTCEPPALDSPAVACPSGQVQLLGDAMCRPLGPPCPAGRFPTVPAPALYVDPTAAPGGDGTEPAPYRTIQSAIDVAQTNTTIALSKGIHTAPVSGSAVRVTLAGACVAETKIEGTLAITGGGIDLRSMEVGATVYGVSGAAIDVAEVAFTGPSRGVHVERSRLTVRDAVFRGTTTAIHGDCSTVEVDDTRFDAVEGAAIALSAGSTGCASSLLAADLLFTGSETPASESRVGVLANAGTTAELRRVAIVRAAGVAISATAAALTVSDSIIRDMRRNRDDAGIGVLIDRSQAAISRTLIEETYNDGIHVRDGSGVLLTDLLVLDSHSTDRGRPQGSGIVLLTSTATVTRALIARAEYTGILASTCSRLNAMDIVSRDQAHDGLVVTGHGQAYVTKIEVARAGTRGITFFASAEEPACERASAFELADATVDGVARTPEQPSFGVHVLGGQLLAERISVANTDVGISVSNVDGKVSDVNVSEVDEIGLWTHLPSTELHANRVRVAGARIVGLRAEGRRFGALTAEDVEIVGPGATGISVEAEVTVFVSKAAVRDVTTAGIAALHTTNVTAEHVRIEGIGAGCTECEGIGADAESAMSLSELVIADCAGAGARLGAGGTLELARGVIRRNPIGVLVLDRDRALDALTSEVHYEDNEIAISVP